MDRWWKWLGKLADVAPAVLLLGMALLEEWTAAAVLLAGIHIERAIREHRGSRIVMRRPVFLADDRRGDDA